MPEDFRAEEEIERIVRFLREWFEENGRTADAVIGLSGGKDSTIVAALAARALRPERVLGVLMPDGEQADIEDAREAARVTGIRSVTVNIHAAKEALLASITAGTGTELSRDSVINLPPRLRMSTLYAVAQSLPHGGRVLNTCNRSEDYVGYSTKYGDAAGDVSPCAEYTVSEMRLIGDALGLPAHLIRKTPSDGLSGMSDEEKLGFTYEALDHYILTGTFDGPEQIRERIDRLHVMNLHKLKTIPTYHRAGTSS